MSDTANATAAAAQPETTTANAVHTTNGTFTVPNPAPPALDASNPQVAALIEQARKQEKDKLYERLNQMEQWKSQFEESAKTIEELKAAKEAEVAAAAEKARLEAEEAAKKQWEETDSKALIAKAQEEWNQKFQTIQQERETERAQFEKEKSFLELQQYAKTKVDEAIGKGEVAPELQHLVTGNTQQEIDASLENVKATTEAIASNMQQALQAAQAQKRGVSPTGYAPVGPMDTTAGSRTLTADDLRDMPMSEYAKVRGSLGMNQQQTNRGLFG